MKVENFKLIGTKRDVADAARNTIGLEPGSSIPSDNWFRRILLAEHSPIRKINISLRLVGLKSWISVHLVRHKYGVEHFVSTQRDDRTGVDRNSSRQDSLVNHEMFLNAQALISISRKRLCVGCAHAETVETWRAVKSEVKQNNPILASVMVPDCIYRGFCYEFTTCGYYKTPAYAEELREYRQDIETLRGE